jgi:hypothetical protein
MTPHDADFIHHGGRKHSKEKGLEAVHADCLLVKYYFRWRRTQYQIMRVLLVYAYRQNIIPNGICTQNQPKFASFI